MKYDIGLLKKHCIETLLAVGVDKADAESVAQVLTVTDARGVHSHGCLRMEGYVSCILSGGIKAKANHVIKSDSNSFALIDAAGGLGIPVSVHAEELVTQKALDNGIAIVNVNNSHHHGSCGYYTIMAARKGLIGLAMSTGDIIMAATGSAVPSIGNNPFSYAIPAGKYGIICYDIAMSTVAAGKVSMAASEGKSIPLGWLLSPEGNPTTDPNDYDKGGPLVPFGGYKGYGLSMMVESLAGILSGAALLGDIHAWNKDPQKSGNVGHCFIAINPNLLNPGFDHISQAERMIDELKATRKAPDTRDILFPGEPEQNNYKLALSEGIALPESSVTALINTAKASKVPFEPEKLMFKKGA